VREQVERGAGAESDGGKGVELGADVMECRLEAEGEEDDAGDHRQVEVAGRREPEQDAATDEIVATNNRGEDEVDEADEKIGNAEQNGVGAEGARDGEGDAQHDRRRGEHREPDGAFVDVDRARQPGIGRPRPPDGRENQHPAEEPAPRRLAREQLRHLGDREDEDQVEEELERGDLVLVAACGLALGIGHRPSLTGRLRGQAEAGRALRSSSRGG